MRSVLRVDSVCGDAVASNCIAILGGTCLQEARTMVYHRNPAEGYDEARIFKLSDSVSIDFRSTQSLGPQPQPGSPKAFYEVLSRGKSWNGSSPNENRILVPGH